MYSSHVIKQVSKSTVYEATNACVTASADALLIASIRLEICLCSQANSWNVKQRPFFLLNSRSLPAKKSGRRSLRFFWLEGAAAHRLYFIHSLGSFVKFVVNTTLPSWARHHASFHTLCNCLCELGLCTQNIANYTKRTLSIWDISFHVYLYLNSRRNSLNS